MALVDEVTPRKEMHQKKIALQIAPETIVEDSPINAREVTFDPKNIPEDKELLESIRQHGVLEPIKVKPIAPDNEAMRFQIVWGHRRVAAARAADLVSIPAFLANAHDDIEMLTIAENSGIRALTSYEKAVLLNQLEERNPGSYSIREMSRITGIPHQSVSTLLSAYRDAPPGSEGAVRARCGAGRHQRA